MRWGALLLGLAFGALALAQNVVLSGAAVVTEIVGVVQFQVGDTPPSRLQPGARVAPGTLVITGADASAVLTFADGQIVVLGERTTFRILSYEFDRKEMSRSGAFLNLIEGSARLVMGAIGLHDPRLIRIQVGTGTLAGSPNPEGGNAVDAGVVVQGASTMVTVSQGRVVLTLPTGQGVVLSSGQGAFVQPGGDVQRGSVAQVIALASQTTNGRQIVDRMDAMQSFAFPRSNPQTVITLATPTGAERTPNAEAAAPLELPPLATSSPTTAATGAGGGGTPCAASCN